MSSSKDKNKLISKSHLLSILEKGYKKTAHFSEELNNKKELLSLYSYWVTASEMWQVCKYEHDIPSNFTTELADIVRIDSYFTRLMVAYSLLYVVIEGYQKLKLKDDSIDEILSHEGNVEALRRLRNANFHYQKDPVCLILSSKKVSEFLGIEGGEQWIYELRQKFCDFFKKSLPIDKFLGGVLLSEN